MKLAGKNVAIVTDSLYEDLEVWYPTIRLREAGAQVRVLSTHSPGTVIKSEHGYEVRVDDSISEVYAKDFDAVVLPGGMAPDELRRHEVVLDFLRDAMEQNKVIASICHGPQLLISAGVLKGRKMTCVDSIKADLINAGVNYVDEEVVRDGNIISSRTPEDLPAFGRELVSALAHEEKEAPLIHK
ncbi:MAG: type 1 glutamine amidotransferase [Thaumarchaeota archaeon]|nr:type 1 glutamine amidotransferase [Nitrososphaerota archaeon]